MWGRQGAGWPGWLSERSVLVAGAAAIALYALFLISGTLLRPGGPLPADMLAFLAAARLAASGHAAAAYDWTAFHLAQAAVLGGDPEAIGGEFGWLNPPHFFFAVLPLAPFEYGWAWLLWIAATALLLAVAAWSVLPRPAAVIGVLAAPSVLLTLSVGQNGLLIAALFAWSFALLDRRPIFAGLAIGLLTVKPQFGLLLPLLLLMSGRWRVFVAATGVALLAMALAWAAFGTEAWRAFLPSLTGNANRMLGADVSPRIQSVYAFLARLIGQERLAVAGHGLVALAVAAVVLRLWLRSPPASEETRAAAAIAGCYLMTPYVWGYDTPSIAVAALFLARAALREGWLPGEKALLLIVCLLPALLIFWQHPLVAPTAWLLVLWLAWSRDQARRSAPAISAIEAGGAPAPARRVSPAVPASKSAGT